MPQKNKSARIEVFRPGTFTPLNGEPIAFSADDLSKIAESYDAENHPTPIVVGHPKVDAPAYGWVTGFSYDETSERLMADVADVNPEFADAVNDGRYKKVSLAFFPLSASSNPNPGEYYPKHVGFLGGRAPAVSGLKTVSFSDEADELIFSSEFGEAGFEDTASLLRNLRDWMIDKFSLEEADKVLPAYRLEWLDDREIMDKQPHFADPANPIPKPKKKEPVVSDKETAAFAERETKATAREKLLDDRESKLLNDGNIAFAESLVTDGKLLPAKKDGLVAILNALPGNVEIAFSEGDEKEPLLDVVKTFLSEQPEIIDYGKVIVPSEQSSGASFASDGAEVDPDQLAIHNKAIAFQAQNPNTDYIAAVKAVS